MAAAAKREDEFDDSFGFDDRSAWDADADTTAIRFRPNASDRQHGRHGTHDSHLARDHSPDAAARTTRPPGPLLRQHGPPDQPSTRRTLIFTYDGPPSPSENSRPSGLDGLGGPSYRYRHGISRPPPRRFPGPPRPWSRCPVRCERLKGTTPRTGCTACRRRARSCPRSIERNASCRIGRPRPNR